MNNLIDMLNQVSWPAVAILTLGIAALIWTRPAAGKALCDIPVQDEVKPAGKVESTCVVIRVRKIYPPESGAVFHG